MPKVTVITPKPAPAPATCTRRLDSILNQTFRDFELIILDDASPDDSRRVIESYRHDPRTRTIFNERNSGSPFKQWNLGLRQATGEYVWIAESDDYAEPTLLETLVDRLDRHPDVGLAMCKSWVVDEQGRTCTPLIRGNPDQDRRADPTCATGTRTSSPAAATSRFESHVHI